MSETTTEVAVRRVTVNLCEFCIAGRGGECHAPGCLLCRNRSPDLPLCGALMEEVPALTDDDLVRRATEAAWRILPAERRQRVLEHLDGEAEMHERAVRTARERAADFRTARRALS